MTFAGSTGRMLILPSFLRWVVGARVWAVAALTWKAAFRFRLFWVLAAMLILAVVVLPLMLKNDGSAQGFIQIMLTYTLSVVTTLLAFSTLWLSCGTLAREIEECQLQMVVVKPIARWQVWVGKLLGITLLNTALLGMAGLSIFILLQWRAQQLPEAQRRVLAQEIFVARGSLREALPNVDSELGAQLQKSPEITGLPPGQRQEAEIQLRERIKAGYQVVAPNHYRRWTIDVGLRRSLLLDQPLFLRVKFHAAQTNQSGSYLGLWRIGPFDDPYATSLPQSLAANSFHEIRIGTGRQVIDPQGRLVINFENRNEVALIFPLEDGLEVLYPEGGFAGNYVRGLVVVLCALTLIAALGLASASLLSFPVAAFFSISLLLVGLSSGTLSSVVAEGTVTGLDHETNQGGSWVDTLLLPLFRVILRVVNLVQQFSPIDSLSNGRSIPWEQLGLAFGQVVLLMGGLLAALGILFFNRRELATAQGHS